MRFVLALLLPSLTLADPTMDSLEAQLGHPEASTRAEATLTLWKTGKAALPSLEKLTSHPDPEIANRAYFVLQRVRLGLTPDSPPELLTLASQLESAPPSQRLAQLTALLDHPMGGHVALFILDHWATQNPTKLDSLNPLFQKLASEILQLRGQWQSLLALTLSPHARAALITSLSTQDHPARDPFITLWSQRDLAEIYQIVPTLATPLTPATHLLLARTATQNHDLLLAQKILADGLALDQNLTLTRALAFLEHNAQIPPIPAQDHHQAELEILRARLAQDHAKIPTLLADSEVSPFFAYESLILNPDLEPPSHEQLAPLPNLEALEVLHSFLARPSVSPDVEALSASITLDPYVLARTLTALACPREASEKLAAEGITQSAVTLLWQTGDQPAALAAAESALNNPRALNQQPIRLTLAQLQLESNQLPEARATLLPVLENPLRRDPVRNAVYRLAAKVFPRPELVPLLPDLIDENAYRRELPIAALLPYPEKVSIFWYEHFRTLLPDHSPLQLLDHLDEFLTQQKPEAQKTITSLLAENPKPNLRPNAPLYQNALFLQLPEALELVNQAAWYDLDSRDLLKILADPSWPDETRQKALQLALKLDPLNPAIQWHHQPADESALETARLSTLGDPALLLQLAALTRKRHTLESAAEVANLNHPAAIQLLHVLADSHAKNNAPAETARLLQAATLAEIASHTQRPVGIRQSLDSLATLYQARAQTAASEPEKNLWLQRLEVIKPQELYDFQDHGNQGDLENP